MINNGMMITANAKLFSMKNPIFFSLLLIILVFNDAFAQHPSNDNRDALMIKRIHDEALLHGKGYDWLKYLTKKIGARLSGSPQSMAAINYTQQVLQTLGLDTVYLQPCVVPHWERGEKEAVRIVNSNQLGSVDLPALALGNSVGTGPYGITAEVIEVNTLLALDTLGRTEIEGKIVFFNRPLDPTHLNTFGAYGGAVDQRVFGASKASKFGAVGVIVRSMTLQQDDVPHTGTTVYEDEDNPIPAIAISTNAADLLSRLLEHEVVSIYMRNTSKMLSDKNSYNVIGEIKGSTYPEEIILVGGHLDSWDVGEGAHDDGAGCVQAMDVLQLLRQMNYQPKRTIRCVLFMNEENGQGGAIAYRDRSQANQEYHVAAIESDRGGFTPLGFTCDGDETIFVRKFRKVAQWASLLEPYHLSISKGGSGADISRLKPQKGLLFGFLPDSQRYFDYHHSNQDIFEVVNKRELQLGTAAITSLVYLIDQYGLD